jgi:carboxylate-amine ligase
MASELKEDLFLSSLPYTLGIELELQLIDPTSNNLVPAAAKLINGLAEKLFPVKFKHDITSEMIEINSGIHTDADQLFEEMSRVRDTLCDTASSLEIQLSGGGTHPFMRWQDLHISPESRAKYLAGNYGYLAYKNTVFGLHIHIGASNGDDAISLIRKLTPYIPHLIAMSASSPFFEWVDTNYDSCRPHAFACTPMTGHLPENITNWQEYRSYIRAIECYGFILNQKDIYWDIRPKQEFGTVEIRICDAPLTIERTCQIAAFCQALSVWVAGQPDPTSLTWLAYDHNYFQASRFGLESSYIEPGGRSVHLGDHLDSLFEILSPIASSLNSADHLRSLSSTLKLDGNDSAWLRKQYKQTGSFSYVVAQAAQAFRGKS